MVFDRCKVQARELYLESYRRNSNEERDLGSKTENDQLVSEALRYGILNGRQGLYPYEVAVISLEESLHMRLAEEQRVEDERYFSDLEVIKEEINKNWKKPCWGGTTIGVSIIDTNEKVIYDIVGDNIHYQSMSTLLMRIKEKSNGNGMISNKKYLELTKREEDLCFGFFYIDQEKVFPGVKTRCIFPDKIGFNDRYTNTELEKLRNMALEVRRIFVVGEKVIEPKR